MLTRGCQKSPILSSVHSAHSVKQRTFVQRVRIGAGLRLFAEVREGEQLVCMHADASDLVELALDVTKGVGA